MVSRREAIFGIVGASAGIYFGDKYDLGSKTKAIAQLTQIPFRGHAELDPRLISSRNSERYFSSTSIPRDDISVCTWNMHCLRGDVAPTLRQLRKDEPELDFLCLQEAPPLDHEFWSQSGFNDYDRFFAPDIYFEREAFGNVILSRHAMNESVVDLPSVTWDKDNYSLYRNALVASSGKHTIVNTHLDFHASPGERLQQLQSVVRECPEEFVLGADLNLMGRWLNVEPSWNFLAKRGFVDCLAEVRTWDFADYITTNIPGDYSVKKYPGEGSDHPLFTASLHLPQY